MLLVACEKLTSQVDHVLDAIVGDPVVDRPVLASGLDEAAPAQARQVIGDVRLGQADAVDQLADRQLLLRLQRFQDAQARRVGKDAEVLGEDLGLGGPGREAKRGFGDRAGCHYRAAHARLLDSHTVAVNGERVRAEAILIATGARPAVPPIPGLENAGYLTSTTALELTEAPRRLAVIGANAVGLELGQMLGNFGSRVTFIARRDIAPNSEPEISAQLREILEADGQEILAPAITTEVALDGADKVLRGTVAGESFERRVDEILVAVGRQPDIEELGLAEAGVVVNDHGAIVVDEHQRTSVPSIYAAGDVTAQPRFVYVAAAGGAAAVQNALLDGEERLDFRALPRIIFTSPAIAQAGLTEATAIESGLDVEARVLPLNAIPRALVNGDTRGLLKLVAEAEGGRLVGVSVLADGAPDVIQAAVLAIEHGMTVDELASAWAPYLAMAEGLKLAAQTFTRDVAKLSCCAA